MLGRLHMNVADCIKVYISFQKLILQKKKARFSPIDIRGRLTSRYSAETFENAIKEIIRSQGLDEDAFLKEAELNSSVTYGILSTLLY